MRTHSVIGGDFNLVQNISKDKKGGNRTTHFKSLEEIEMLKENMDLTDIWRDLHPNEQRFTWRRNKPEIHCRLDFFLSALVYRLMHLTRIFYRDLKPIIL